MPRELKGLTKNPLPLEGRDSLEELSNERAAQLKAPGGLGTSEGFALRIRALNFPELFARRIRAGILKKWARARPVLRSGTVEDGVILEHQYPAGNELSAIVQ